MPGLAFEAHSTDYQTEAALTALVQCHFAILKVGPWLTFAMREALFALAAIEGELLPAEDRSPAARATRAAMLADPSHWQGHYAGSEAELRLARAFSLSDRCRYYWPVPEVAAAVDRLFANLGRTAAAPAAAQPVSAAPARRHPRRPADGGAARDRAARSARSLAVYARACGERAQGLTRAPAPRLGRCAGGAPDIRTPPGGARCARHNREPER